MRWFWFRVHYGGFAPVTLCMTSVSLASAYALLWQSDAARARYRVTHPKKNWNKPLPRIVKIDVIAPPPELKREPNFQKFLDECIATRHA